MFYVQEKSEVCSIFQGFLETSQNFPFQNKKQIKTNKNTKKAQNRKKKKVYIYTYIYIVKLQHKLFLVEEYSSFSGKPLLVLLSINILFIAHHSFGVFFVFFLVNHLLFRNDL